MENSQIQFVGLSLVEHLAEIYRGIKEVPSFDDGEKVINGGETDTGEIEEVINTSEDENVVKGGEVSSYDHGGTFLKACVTITVLSVWMTWNLLGLLEYERTGSTILLLTSPATMSIPVYKVLGHVFAPKGR